MGFRTGSYATVWSVESVSDTRTKARISISRRNRQTGEYDTDFSGFIDFIGTAAAKKAMALKEKDRIRLGDVDVSNNYVKEKNITYVNYKVFSFETQAEIDAGGSGNANASGYSGEPQSQVDSGEIDDSRLPF